MLSLPFTGPAVIPPTPIAEFLAAGLDVHSFDRPRIARDERGYDCNDRAYDAVQALKDEGRTPFYIDCKTENGEGHLIAAYATDDGVIYARDNRHPDGDLPLEELVARGYALISASDIKGTIWHAPA